MKQPFLFLALALPFFAAAQNYTSPDSSLIRKNKVKMVKIEFENEKGDRYEHKYLEYDKKGRVIKEYENPKAWYYKYGYDNKNRMTSSRTFAPDGNATQKVLISYDEKKNEKTTTVYFAGDTTQISVITKYEISTEAMTYQEQYAVGKLVRVVFVDLKDGKQIGMRDSSINNAFVTERKSGSTVRNSYYKKANQDERHCFFTYENNLLIRVRDSVPGQTVLNYQVVYDRVSRFEKVLLDGKALSKDEQDKWTNKYGYLMPRNEEDYGLPVPDLVEKRKPVYGKNGLITEEAIQSNFSSNQNSKFIYTYSYR